MKQYLSGSQVTIAIDLIDRFGNAVQPTTISYFVKDHNGVEKVGPTKLAYNGEDTAVTVTIPGDANTAAVNEPNELRVVVLECATDTGTSLVTTKYLVEQAEPLIVGVNSFVTLDQAELISLRIPGLEWDMATHEERVAALLDSKERLCRLSYTLIDMNNQDMLTYVPQTPYYTGTRINSIFNINGNLAYIGPEQYKSFPTKFTDALAKAQVADAAETLNPDRVTEMRRKGIILDTVGQSKQMFSSSRPVDSAVCKRALGYLSAFINSSIKIGRA